MGLVEGRRHGVPSVFKDSGPGIPDLDLAITDGWTSGGGLGLGLGGARGSSTSSPWTPRSAGAPGHGDQMVPMSGVVMVGGRNVS